MICAGHFAEERRGVPEDGDDARLWEDDAAAGGRLRTGETPRSEGIAAPDRHAGGDCGHGAEALRAENVARELIYYHFANRNGLIEAVIDDYVEDLVESVIVWNEARVFGDTPGSLRKCIRTFRYSLYDGAGRPRPMIGVLEELGVRDAFDVRATRETADCLANHIAKEYAAYHRIEIELVREMFCVVIFGLVGLVKMNPQIEDDVLMKVIEQTLRLDMAPIGKGEG